MAVNLLQDTGTNTYRGTTVKVQGAPTASTPAPTPSPAVNPFSTPSPNAPALGTPTPENTQIHNNGVVRNGNGVIVPTPGVTGTGVPTAQPNAYADLWKTTGQNPQAFVSSYIQQKGLRGAQADPAALTDIVNTLKGLGVNAELDTRSDGLHKGIMLNGQFVKMLDGSDNWIWQPGTGSAVDNTVSNSFSDPSTQQFASLLEQQLALLKGQQQQQVLTNDQLKARQDAALQSSDALVAYMKQRSDQLKQPGYTPSEQNILKTAATDPIEADRQAALKRALENVGSRGFDPTSGIAQDLLRQVNQGYDQSRNTAQNGLAVNQINEQRSREQEAQQLMAMIPQAQMAAAQGDLSFLQQLDAAVAQLGNQASAAGGQLYELPMNSAQLALSALGQSPSPQSLTAQTIQLAQLAQQQGANSGAMWAQIGASFAPFLR